MEEIMNLKFDTEAIEIEMPKIIQDTSITENDNRAIKLKGQFNELFKYW